MYLKDLHSAIEELDANRVQELIQYLNRNDINDVYHQETALTRAVRQKSKEIIAAILEHPFCDVNVRNQFDRTALYYATLDGNIDRVKMLLQKGSDVNISDIVGVTPLGVTAFYDHSEIADLLIRLGSSVNIPCRKGETPLYRACYNISNSVVKLLIENECDVNFQTSEGKTALIASVISNDNDRGKLKSKRNNIMTLLLENRANPDIQDKRLYSALHYAVEGNDLYTASLLLEYGCRFDLLNTDNMTAFDIATSRGKQNYEAAILFFQYGYHTKHYNEELTRNIIFRNKYLQTDKIARQKLLQIVLDDMREYLNIGTRVEDIVSSDTEENLDPVSADKVRTYFIDIKCPMPLKCKCRIVIRRHLSTNFLQSLSKLNIPLPLKNFLLYDINLRNSAPTIRKLFLAIEECSSRKVEHFVKQGIDINFMFGGETPLMKSARYNHASLVQYFLQKNADCGFANGNGDTAIHIASRHGNIDTIRMLLNYSTCLSYKNSAGNTPLHEALGNGHIECCILLAYYCSDKDVNQPDSRGIPLLHYAVGNGSYELTATLLEKGANVNLQDASGNTVMHVATTKGAIYLRKNVELPALFDCKSSSSLFTASLLMCDASDVGLKCSKLMTCEKQSAIIYNLLEAGSDINILNYDGKNARNISDEYGFHNYLFM